MRQRRVIRNRNTVAALEYSGEVVRKSRGITDAGAPFGLAGPHFDLTVRRDDGTKITATLPISLDYRFPVGCRVVKRSGHLWPEPTDAPTQNPNEDQST